MCRPADLRHDWKSTHETLGCHGCKFADKTELDNGPCCTRHGGVSDNTDDGHCDAKRPDDDKAKERAEIDRQRAALSKIFFGQ